jgi:hypothetical protein
MFSAAIAMGSDCTRSCDSGTPPDTQHLVQCRYDGRPCEVATQFTKPLHPRTLAVLQPNLPCDQCRGAEHAAKNLCGVRLGREERRWLTVCAPPDPENWMGTIVGGEVDDHSSREVLLRAARKLERIGLVVTRRYATNMSYQEPRPNGRAMTQHPRRRAWLTPFGFEIARIYEKELRTGARIRWDARVDAALITCRRSPSELFARFVALSQELLSSDRALDEAFKQGLTYDESCVLGPMITEAARDVIAASEEDKS